MAEHQALLNDPQTSGGLLVSCAPPTLDDVPAIIRRHGLVQAAAVGSIAATHATPRLVLR